MSVGPDAASRILRRARPSVTRCRLLAEDPDLMRSVPESARVAALSECTARVIRVPRGRWAGVNPSDPDALPAIGLLVLEGLLIRRVGIDGRFGAEILGEGDILRPWKGENEPHLPLETGWRVLEPTRMAVLDSRVAYRLARYPLVAGALVDRTLERSRHLAVNMAIVHHPRVHVRLHMLFWHLADRWGRVSPDGVRLELRLTHTVISELVAVRRPTVSTALADLARRRLIESADGGWLLRGEPPNELLEVQPVTLAGG